MPETGFLLTQTEEHALVAFILSKGAFLVPDVEYNSKCYSELRTAEEFRRSRASTPLFFALHDDSKVTPLEFNAIRKHGRTVYYVMQRNGGPTIDFLTTSEFSEGGIEKVNPGFIAFHGTFWNPSVGENQLPPAPLLNLYRDLKNFLRMRTKQVKLGKRTYWIGNEMASALQSGVKSLGIKGVSLPTL